MPFLTLGLDANILRAVQEAGYTEPTPIQSSAIPEILNGHDLIGIAQTGTGKTAAFTLPILSRMAAVAQSGSRLGTQVLVIAPTRELVVQIEENIRIYGKYLRLSVATVFGGVGEHPQIRALRSGANIIIACPGRLLDLMGRRCADFTNLKYLVLDEADRMLDMGFLPSIKQVVRALPKTRQTLLFSATLSNEIESLTHEFQRNPKRIQIGRRSNPADTVTQWVHEVPKHLKSTLLVHLLSDPQMNMVLVFSRMKHSADRIARHLESRGIRTATLHSNRSQNQRLQALKDFKSGAVRVLVATDIAARGIDVDGISHVINFDFPMHPEDYVHRIGRTGRAQAVGDAISFVTPEDQGELRSLERFLGRGILRKRAEGFDYHQAAAPMPAEPAQRGRSGGRSGGGGRDRNSRGGGGGGGGRSHGSSSRRGPDSSRGHRQGQSTGGGQGHDQSSRSRGNAPYRGQDSSRGPQSGGASGQGHGQGASHAGSNAGAGSDRPAPRSSGGGAGGGGGGGGGRTRLSGRFVPRGGTRRRWGR